MFGRLCDLPVLVSDRLSSVLSDDSRDSGDSGDSGDNGDCFALSLDRGAFFGVSPRDGYANTPRGIAMSADSHRRAMPIDP